MKQSSEKRSQKRPGWMFGGQDSEQKKRNQSYLEGFLVVLLAFLPLRHISWGLDLWDTGYNYANFTYMGTEHMDPMWLFSTYLSTAVGHLLTKLPNAGNLLGMNFYTGLFASLLALLGYWFSTRTLKMPVWIAFLGELTAISLCWCPTALLYNYLTYVLFLAAVILLYRGLTGEKRNCLIAAGVCLGANVLVRFSNLPEAAMIVAVWAYDFIAWREGRKRAERKAESTTPGTARAGSFWRGTLQHTGWCLLGYMAALVLLCGYIGIRYGLDEYAAGISRLFAMTDNATDYKATSMLMGMIRTYVENLYWAARIGVIVAGGMVLFALAGAVEGRLARQAEKRGKAEGQSGTSRGLNLENRRGKSDRLKPEDQNGKRGGSWREGLAAAIHLTVVCACVLLGAAMLFWLYWRKFCSFDFYSYDSILRPGILFLMLAMLLAVIRIFHPKSPKEEKLISGMVLLVILLTSIGSNNGVYPSLNNLFVAAPYTLWESWRFVRGTVSLSIPLGRKKKTNVIISPFPAKVVLAAFLLLCAVQFGGFGIKFTFAEATGVQDVSASVSNNEILRSIKMSSDKAECMTELSAYITDNDLQGQEVILYGGVPSLSYYLQMPSAFNPWSDLLSYSKEVMDEELQKLESETPVIILGNSYALYEEGGEEALKASGVSEKEQQSILSDEKWVLLKAFMQRNGYQQTFRNEMFAVYR